MSSLNNPISEYPYSDSIRVLILNEAKKKNIRIATRKIENKLIVYRLERR